MRLFIIILISAGLIGMMVFFSIPAVKEMHRSRAIEKEIEALREEADKISTENKFLREQVEYLKSDHYKERLAKDKLNLRNQGEQIAVVQPSTSNDQEAKELENNLEEIKNNDTEDISNFQKWWKYFFE